MSVIVILKKSHDRLPIEETENALECSSQHLKNPVISRICEFYGCRNVGKRKIHDNKKSKVKNALAFLCRFLRL